MKSLIFSTFEQHGSLRNAPSASALLVQHHKVVEYDDSTTGYIYTNLTQIEHVLTGCTVDDPDGTPAVPASAIGVNLAGKTWDDDTDSWKIPVMRTAGTNTGDTFVTLYGRLTSSVG
jgi:hypothetical protein